MKTDTEKLRSRFSIKYKNEYGVDAGGLSREFFYLMSETIFSKEKGLFDLYDQNSSYFYISNSWKTKNIDEYYFVG